MGFNRVYISRTCFPDELIFLDITHLPFESVHELRDSAVFVEYVLHVSRNRSNDDAKKKRLKRSSNINKCNMIIYNMI